MDNYAFELIDNPDSSHSAWLSKQLSAYNVAQVGYADAQQLLILVKDEQGQPVGGLSGWTYWGWRAIDLLWLSEAARGRGHGARLLQMAEETARQRGCTHALLDTMSFQAPEFYLKYGYEVFGVIDGIAGKHRRYYFRKALT